MQTVAEIEDALEVARHEDEAGNTSVAETPIRIIQRHFDESDPEWEFYLERVAEAAPLSVKGFTKYLRTNSVWGSPADKITPEKFALEERWIQLFTLCKSYLFSGRLEAAVETLETRSQQFADVDDGFEQRGMYLHLESQVLGAIGGEENVREAFDLALQANSSVNGHSGVQNNVGKLVATALSEDYCLSGIHSLAGSNDQLVRIGLDLVREAVSDHDEVPAYHVTYGRLLTHDGDFERARSEIREGIRLLDRTRERYYVKRTEFQRFRSQIERQHKQQTFDGLSESMDELETSLSNAKSEITSLEDRSENQYEKLESKYDEILREFQTRNLQFMGVFAGLLTVTIALVDVAIHRTYAEAAGLILLLVGGLLVAFTGLLTVLPKREPVEKGVQSQAIRNAVVGFSLILAGLAVPSVL